MHAILQRLRGQCSHITQLILTTYRDIQPCTLKLNALVQCRKCFLKKSHENLANLMIFLRQSHENPWQRCGRSECSISTEQGSIFTDQGSILCRRVPFIFIGQGFHFYGKGFHFNGSGFHFYGEGFHLYGEGSILTEYGSMFTGQPHVTITNNHRAGPSARPEHTCSCYRENSIVPPVIDLNALWHTWKQRENCTHFWREWELTCKNPFFWAFLTQNTAKLS